MSELLQIIIDFNLEKLCQSNSKEGSPEAGAMPLQILFDSLLKFLNAFLVQSALNRYRIYLALPRLKGQSKMSSCYLLFPLEESGAD